MRVSKVTTKTGDKGDTNLGDGTRVSKSNIKIEFLGELDELNAWIGYIKSVCPISYQDELTDIQQDLLNIGGEASVENKDFTLLKEIKIKFLEKRLAELNKDLTPLKEFILPGGDEFSTRVHLGRTVCRRVERKAVSLSESGANTRFWIPYLNRLSDYLFVLARYHGIANQEKEIQWRRNP